MPAALLALFACGAAKEAAIHSAVEEIWNEGDMSLIDENYTEELGNEVKRFVSENRELYPDLTVEIKDVIVKGNTYVTVWEVHGTHKFLDTEAVLEGVSVRKREGGVFTEELMFYDMKSVYDQLGFKVVPPEGFGPFGKVEVSRKEVAAPTATIEEDSSSPKATIPSGDAADKTPSATVEGEEKSASPKATVPSAE